MAMMKTLTAALVAACAAFAAPAAAQNYAFTGNPVPVATLTFDNVTPYAAIDTGFIDSLGRHTTTNQSLDVGANGDVSNNNYFTFVIGAAAPASPYTSATLRITNGLSGGAYPFTYSLFDVNASPADLDTSRATSTAAGQALYADLGSGTFYGSYVFTGATTQGSITTIALNQAFVDQVNRGLLTTFSIGGTLSPSAGGPAVPEPAGWAMIILGMGAVGAALRAAKRRSDAKFDTKIRRIAAGLEA